MKKIINNNHLSDYDFLTKIEKNVSILKDNENLSRFEELVDTY